MIHLRSQSFNQWERRPCWYFGNEALFKDERLVVIYSTSPDLSLAKFPMSAALPTSSSPQDVPPASLPPEISRDSGPDPTPAAITPSAEVVEESKPDEPSTSLPSAPRPQSPEQPPGHVDLPARVELHAPDPAQAHFSAPARPHSASAVSLTERNRSLPSIPANAALAPQREALLQPRFASDPVYGHANRRSHRWGRSEPPPAQPLDIPGSRVIRQRPAIHPGEFEFQVMSPTRVQSPFQVRPLRQQCCVLT